MGHCDSSAQLGGHGEFLALAAELLKLLPRTPRSQRSRRNASSARSLGAWALLSLLRLYMMFLSPFFGGACKFYPSCSNYAYEAVARHGARRGSVLAIKRLLRCRPFTQGGFDPVPEELPERQRVKPSAADGAGVAVKRRDPETGCRLARTGAAAVKEMSDQTRGIVFVVIVIAITFVWMHFFQPPVPPQKPATIRRPDRARAKYRPEPDCCCARDSRRAGCRHVITKPVEATERKEPGGRKRRCTTSSSRTAAAWCAAGS